MTDEMYFPPGQPTREEDPRRLMDELWRAHDRTARAAYGERYVALEPLIDRAARLNEAGWQALVRLYGREHSRRRLPEGLELEWMERAASRRVSR